MRAGHAAGWWLCLALAACADAPLQAQAQAQAQEPALLTADPANAAILKAVVEHALGVPVVLAADALTSESQLVIEPRPAMADGRRIQGRETRRPELFTLLLVKGECVLRRERNGELLPLAGVTCRSNAAGH
jgi:hypothetical protein